MTIYKVTLKSGYHFLMCCDMVQAAAPIRCNFFYDPPEDGESNWGPTPYQTADARHNVREAAALMVKYYDLDDENGKPEKVKSVKPIKITEH